MGSPVSLQAAVSRFVSYQPVSLEMLALKLGMNAPVSLMNMAGTLNGMPTTMSFSQTWTTPDGTALGGTVDLTVNIDGTYTVDFNTTTNSHVVGVSYDYQLRAYLSSPGLPNCMFFYHAGNVGANLTKQGVEDHTESGSNPLISMYWGQIVNSATFSVAKDYKWAGVVGTIDDLVSDLLDIGAGALGAAIGAVIGLTKEAIGFLGGSLGPGGTIGVLAGVAIFVVADIAGFGLGTALMLGTVAGAAVGAVTSALIQSRPMTSQEIQFAQQVFASEIPFQNVMLSNLSSLNGRAFTAPGVDGKTYCNLGDAYNNPQTFTNGAYPFGGEVLIHELTHAWQIAHNSFIPGFVCSGVVNQANYMFGDDVYAYGPAGPNWSNFNLEQQAQIVNQWFAGAKDGGNQDSWPPMATTGNPYFQYIQGNILTGSAGFSNSWL